MSKWTYMSRPIKQKSKKLLTIAIWNCPNERYTKFMLVQGKCGRPNYAIWTKEPLWFNHSITILFVDMPTMSVKYENLPIFWKLPSFSLLRAWPDLFSPPLANPCLISIWNPLEERAVKPSNWLTRSLPMAPLLCVYTVKCTNYSMCTL